MEQSESNAFEIIAETQYRSHLFMGIAHFRSQIFMEAAVNTKLVPLHIATNDTI